MERTAKKEKAIKIVKEVYVCEACKMAYLKKELAEKCEEFCTRHNSCNMKITKYSVGAVRLV